MDNNVSNFCIKKYLNPNYDITWSFQYNLSGNSNTDGGFTTFLSISAKNSSTSGGGGSSLGIGPKSMPYGTFNKVNGNVICVAIDSTGMFATSAAGSVIGFKTGLSSPIPNSMVIRINNDLQFLTAFPLSSVNLNGLINSDKLETLRFNLTNLGKTLNIDRLNEFGQYVNVYSTTNTFNLKLTNPLKVCFSQASPIDFTSLKSRLTLKDIHIQGKSIDFSQENAIEYTHLLTSPNRNNLCISNKNQNVGRLIAS